MAVGGLRTEGHDIAGIEPEKRPCEDPDVITIVQPQLSEKEPSMTCKGSLEILSEKLKLDGIDVTALQQYLSELAAKKNGSIDLIVQSALIPGLLPKFKASFQKFLDRISAESESEPEPVSA